MKLCGGRLSPYYERIILQMKLKNLEDDIELPGIPGGDRQSDEFLALNPLGKVPVLIDGDFALPESGVIAEYLEEKFPEPSLLPGDAVARARVRLIARLGDTYLINPLFIAFGQLQAREPDQGILDLQKAEMNKGLVALEHFAEGGARLVGDGWTLADCALIPIFFFLDRFSSPLEIETYADRPKLKAWRDAVLASDLGGESETAMQVALDEFMAARAA